MKLLTPHEHLMIALKNIKTCNPKYWAKKIQGLVNVYPEYKVTINKYRNLLRNKFDHTHSFCNSDPCAVCGISQEDWQYLHTKMN